MLSRRVLSGRDESCQEVAPGEAWAVVTASERLSGSSWEAGKTAAVWDRSKLYAGIVHAALHEVYYAFAAREKPSVSMLVQI